MHEQSKVFGFGWRHWAVLGAALLLVGAALPASGAGDAASAEAEVDAGSARAVFNRPTYSSPIAISADDRLVWVVNPRNDTVSVIRTDTNAVLRTIAVGDEPRSVAVDANNTMAFVANAASNNVTVIRITNPTFANFAASVLKTVPTGAEPWDIVISPDNRRVFVANSGQDTLSVMNGVNGNLLAQVNLRNSICNDPDRQRHFQPRGLAVTQSNTQLYVTRFLSFTRVGGVQGVDNGKEGIVCRLNINTSSTVVSGFQPALAIPLAATNTGFVVDSTGDGVADPTFAFPNQLQSIVIRGSRAYLPNIAASPKGPLRFNVDTQAYVNSIGGIGSASQTSLGALNLHLGARNPEPGKIRLFFSNPWAIAFTNQSGPGTAYVVSAGSDLLVKLNVNAAGALSFTVDSDTTRYIDLNDPANVQTNGNRAGKNPVGIAINSSGNRAYVANFVSGTVSVVNTATDSVIRSIRTSAIPAQGTLEERLIVGAEIFFSSRGHFNEPPGTTVSVDDRLSSEGWQNCASCHFNGWTDGVIWQFNAGPRKSVNLAGSFNPSNPSQQKILNYSAIFDEVQDFEINIRNVSGPGPLAAPTACESPPGTSTFDPNHGLLIGDNNDIDVPPCTVVAFLKANAGRAEIRVTLPGHINSVRALTALKEWVQFAVRVPNGPLNNTEVAGGVPIADINAGRILFDQQQCDTCHSGGLWSTSLKNFTSPPAAGQIFCEVNAGPTAPPGCQTAPFFGNPVGAQYLNAFLENVGSFNRGVAGGNNQLNNNIGAVEKATAALNAAGVSGAEPDALGLDYNQDGRGLGFNVQSLLGGHAVPPYYHNGACESVACVVNDVKHRTANFTVPDVLDTIEKRANVVRFVQSIDAETAPF